MAFIDDPEFVIAHIRHSCVVTDDTGELCTDQFETLTFSQAILEAFELLKIWLFKFTSPELKTVLKCSPWGHIR